MNNGLLYLGGLLVLVLSVLFAVPNFIDWNGYRGVFEEEASKVLGRDVRVGGAVNLKLLPVPYVRFEKIRIADPTGQTGEPFLRAESFTMWLSGPALLRGVLEASEVAIDKPVISLALDGRGGGNWSNVELRSGDLPFVPRDVALRSVKLIDGALSIYNAEAERVASADAINGELSADGLKGPYRFKGEAAWSGATHDMRFVTSPVDAEGGLGLKAQVAVEGSPNSYMLDGAIAKAGEKPVFTGNWNARLAVPGIDQVADSGVAPVLDFTSRATIDATSATFDDMSLSLQNAAEPQTITGTATASWTDVPRFDVKLKSKWLDIDRLAGAGQAGASFPRLKGLVLGMMSAVAGDRSISARVDLDQVKIGGETTGGLVIDSERRKGVTHFKQFTASLPGASRLDLDGDLKDDGGKLSFAGNASIRGTSFARLRSWSERSGLAIDVKADGPYSASGKIDIGADRFSLADATGEISGRALSGDLSIRNDSRSKTELTLQAARLDTREVFPKTVKALKREFSNALGFKAADDEVSSKDLPDDLRLRVVAGELTDGTASYRDVDLTFEVSGDEIRLSNARITTGAGLAVSLEGRIKGGKGTLAYDVVAPTHDAVADLARQAGLGVVLGPSRLEGLHESKLAGLLRLAQRTGASTDVTFDGTLNGSRITGFSEFDEGLQIWRSRPTRMQMTLDSPSLAELAVVLGRDDNPVIKTATEPAQAFVIATGVADSGLETRAEVSSQGLAMNFAGRTTWPEDAVAQVAGSVDVKAGDFADALALAGLPLPAGAGGVATHGTLDVARDNAKWTIAGRGLTLGTSTLKGSVDIAFNGTGAPKVTGKIMADHVTVAGLLSTVTDKPLPVAGTPGNEGEAAADERSVWPDGTFNFAGLRGSEADVTLQFKTLDLSGNLATGDGQMKLRFEPMKFAATEITANAAGGLLTGDIALAREGNGTSLTSHFKLENSTLSALSPAASGRANYELTTTAKAQSPAGLIAELEGSGKAELTKAIIPGPRSATASNVTDLVMHGKLVNDPRVIANALSTILGSAKLDLGDRQIPITVSGGSLKFESVAIDAADGKLDALATVDLMGLNLTASAQIVPIVKPLPAPAIPLPNYEAPADKGALPPAIVLYSGRLDDLGSVRADIDVAEMQRELAARQMERNVEELDRSRRVDEERGRLDKERRAAALAALVAERARKAAEAAAARDAAEKLPPVLPESAGTANTSEPPASNAPVTTGTADQLPLAPDAREPGNTVLTPKISVEPIPSSEIPSGDADAPAIDPATGLPAAPKSQAVARPPALPRSSAF